MLLKIKTNFYYLDKRLAQFFIVYIFNFDTPLIIMEQFIFKDIFNPHINYYKVTFIAKYFERYKGAIIQVIGFVVLVNDPDRNTYFWSH